MKLRKRFAAMGAAMVMAVSMMSMGANADFISGQYDTYNTPGGTGGVVRIRSGAYMEIFEPSGGVHVYYYGPKAKITTASTLVTKFTITCNLYKSGSSPVAFNKTATANSIEKLSTTHYDFCTGTVKTTSTAYGNTTKNLNYTF